jgi:hypothetical protein
VAFSSRGIFYRSRDLLADDGASESIANISYEKQRGNQMLETKIYNPPISLMVRGLESDRLELSRLMAAAAVNPKFCNLLLEDPELALATGFHGETFSFTDEERDLIRSIRADSLADLACQLAQTFIEPLPANPPVHHPFQSASSLGY